MNVSKRTRVRVAVLCAALIACSLTVFAAVSTVSISGTPAAVVSAQQLYSFSPRAAVQGAGAPSFAIENKPRWATFSTFNGRLTGTPTNADAGTYPNIRISITDGTSRAYLPIFAIKVQGLPQMRSVSLNWQPPTENTDGSVLTDLVGYRIYTGQGYTSLSPQVTLSNPSISRYVLEELAPGQHHFAITAVNAAGRESPVSNVVSATIE